MTFSLPLPSSFLKLPFVGVHNASIICIYMDRKDSCSTQCLDVKYMIKSLLCCLILIYSCRFNLKFTRVKYLFFEMDLTIKVNGKRERRFDRPTVIFKFKMRSKNYFFYMQLCANFFMCNVEEQLTNQNKMPAFYKRYVDDTLSKMPDVSSASEFLSTLNEIHPSVSFTMELEDNGKLPFLGMVIIRNGPRLDTKVYRKPTDTGLLLHYQN